MTAEGRLMSDWRLLLHQSSTSRVVIDQLVSATESFHTRNELNRDYYQKKTVAPKGFCLQ